MSNQQRVREVRHSEASYDQARKIKEECQVAFLRAETDWAEGIRCTSLDDDYYALTGVHVFDFFAKVKR